MGSKQYKYFLRFGYFGDKGKYYIPFWKAYIYSIFTNYVIYKEDAKGLISEY